MPPRLAVCVPTHHGRAGTLDELLTRLAAEPGSDEVEVCIGDNASTDGTAEVVARHRSTFGARLHYARHPRNLGMAENVLRTVELATADHCWLMGSDDAPAPGALARVRELVDEHEGASGLALGHMRVGGTDLDTPGYVVVPEPYPPHRAVTRFRTVREFVDSVGYVTFFTSNNVVRRDRWQAVVDAERDRVLRAGCAPHLYVTARMALRDADWVWCPEPLVLSRQAALYLSDPDELGDGSRPRHSAVARRVLADLDRIWADVHGRGSYAHRALMYRAIRHHWNRESILIVRTGDPGVRETLANLASARRLWWSRWFWRESLPALLVPMNPLRSAARPSTRFAAPVLRPEHRAVSLRGDVPAAMTAGYGHWIRVRIENRGRVALSSALPHPVRLAARWHDTDDGRDAGDRAPPAALWPPLRPGRARLMDVFVAPPWRPGTYRMHLTALQFGGGGWFDEADAGNALTALVSVDQP